MNAKRVLFRFFLASVAAFTALVYLNSTYESIILYFSDRLLQKLDLASRIVHDKNEQLHVVIFLTEGVIQIKLAGFNWVYASQATAVGILLSAESKISKKVFWLITVCTLLALSHTGLQILAIFEVHRHINGTNGWITTYGASIFKLYRHAVPVLLLSLWVVLSRNVIFSANTFEYHNYFIKASDKVPASENFLKNCSVNQQDSFFSLPNNTATRRRGKLDRQSQIT